MALVSGGGPGTPNPSGGTIPFADAGYVLEQYTYDPYGSIVAAENFDLDGTGKSLHAVNRVGHQGLFFERFDGSYTDQTLAEGGLPGLTPNAQATGLYYNRNRWFSPQLGCFMTRDPNGAGMPIIAAMAVNGEAVAILFGEFDGQGLYGDGMNLYQYASSNPVNNRDPLGLSSEYDPFAEVEDLMMHIQMERANWAEYARQGITNFAMGALKAAAQWAAIAAITAVCPPLGMAITAVICAEGVYDTLAEMMADGWRLTWGRGARLALNAAGMAGSLIALERMATAERLCAAPYEARGRPMPASKVLGRYSYMKDSKTVGPGKLFTRAQKRKILAANRARNGGVLRDDITGEILSEPTQCKKGITPAECEAQIDHIIPRSKGGTNSYSNAQVISRRANIAKSDN